MNDRAVRLPRFWFGLIGVLVGAWWVTHDETMKYVFGLLFLTAGLVALATVILRRMPSLKRVAVVAGCGLVVVATGIAAPIVRVDTQTSSVWTTHVGSTSPFLIRGAILLARYTPVEGSPLVVAVSPKDGRIIKKIGKQQDGGEAPMFTAEGDFVQVSKTVGSTRVDYYTYADGRRWSRQFPSSRLKHVEVIAGGNGFAAVRTCPPDDGSQDWVCSVTGVGPDGATVWTKPLRLILNYDRPDDRLVPDVLGAVPGSVNQFRRLSLRDGSVLEDGGAKLGDDSAQILARKHDPKDRLTGLFDPVSSTIDVGDLRLVAGEELTASKDGKEIWRTHISGPHRFVVANGGIAVTSDPQGWSPFLPWRTDDATRVTMLRPRDGKVMATATVPYSPSVYPINDHSALVTGGNYDLHDGVRGPGVGEQRLVGKR